VFKSFIEFTKNKISVHFPFEIIFSTSFLNNS
jgi:hypothetical protein